MYLIASRVRSRFRADHCAITEALNILVALFHYMITGGGSEVSLSEDVAYFVGTYRTGYIGMHAAGAPCAYRSFVLNAPTRTAHKSHTPRVAPDVRPEPT